MENKSLSKIYKEYCDSIPEGSGIRLSFKDFKIQHNQMKALDERFRANNGYGNEIDMINADGSSPVQQPDNSAWEPAANGNTNVPQTEIAASAIPSGNATLVVTPKKNYSSTLITVSVLIIAGVLIYAYNNAKD